MRTTHKRDIKGTLRAIEKLWTKHPELRLGQLLINAVSEYEIYNIHDDELIKRMKLCYALLKGPL